MEHLLLFLIKYFIPKSNNENMKKNKKNKKTKNQNIKISKYQNSKILFIYI